MPEREKRSIAAEFGSPHTLTLPSARSRPFVFCSPHSGRLYPDVLLERSRLCAHALRKSEDCYVDELLDGVVDHGAPLMGARFPRAYVDVNREPYELDPDLFEGPLPRYANTQSVRVIGGLGTIARVVAEGEEIYRARLPVGIGLARIDGLYKPFHATLADLLDQTWARFGLAVLIDCHSMPSTSVGQPMACRPDFVLGDRFGVSCDSRLTRSVREELERAGYEVHVNRPYAGGFITEHYGRPRRGLHALQLEINRALYLDETTLLKTVGFQPLKASLTRAMANVMNKLPSILGSRAAAE